MGTVRLQTRARKRRRNARVGEATLPRDIVDQSRGLRDQQQSLRAFQPHADQLAAATRAIGGIDGVQVAQRDACASASPRRSRGRSMPCRQASLQRLKVLREWRVERSSDASTASASAVHRVWAMRNGGGASRSAWMSPDIGQIPARAVCCPAERRLPRRIGQVRLDQIDRQVECEALAGTAQSEVKGFAAVEQNALIGAQRHFAPAMAQPSLAARMRIQQEAGASAAAMWVGVRRRLWVPSTVRWFTCSRPIERLRTVPRNSPVRSISSPWRFRHRHECAS